MLLGVASCVIVGMWREARLPMRTTVFLSPLLSTLTEGDARGRAWTECYQTSIPEMGTRMARAWEVDYPKNPPFQAVSGYKAEEFNSLILT